jgi:ribosomal protein S18 acetylase RimI-like enzyme
VGINSDIADIDWPLENPIGLNRLAVAPPHQGYGYGQKLLSAGIEIARARGNDGVVLLVSPDNHAAIRLYERNGFQQCGEMFGWGFDWLKYYLKF